MVASAVLGHDVGIEAAEQASGLIDGKVITTLEVALGAGRILESSQAQVVFASTSPGFNVRHQRRS